MRVPFTLFDSALAALAIGVVGCTGGSELLVTAEDPTIGRQDALVTVVGFGDFQCPYTAKGRVALNGAQRLHPEDVRVAWKNYPLSFHPAARRAAAAGALVHELGGNEAYERFADRVFSGSINDASLEMWAGEAGVSVEDFRARLDSGEGEAKVQSDLDLAEGLGVHAAPTFFVNGREIDGARPSVVFERAIDEALAEANELLAQGVDRSLVYDILVSRNLASTY